MAFILRYNANNTGAITFTGNTLGLSRSGDEGVPGTRDYIGAFTTVDTAMQFGSYPPGTTGDFLLNSATAFLRLPEGSEVLYAELVWAGTYRVSGGTNNYIDYIDKSVAMTTPAAATFAIAPDPATAQLSYRNATYNYFRSANVTEQVRNGGAGPYTVGGVVGNIDLGNSTANSAGWTLCVVYDNPALPFRNLSLNVGIVEIAVGSDPSVTTTITGFATPTEGPVNGRMALCAQDGDANKTGDQVLFGPTEADLMNLSGPNNFLNNFFASQINDDSGNLDTSGTFGDRNQINGQPGTQIVGGRQSWDITNVDISRTLANNQTSAVFQLRTTNDGYSVLAIGIYIDINAPLIGVLKSVDAEVAEIGQVLTYTVIITNNGTVSANAMFLLDGLPNDTEFVEGSVTVNGSGVPGDPVAGIPLGTLPPGESIVVTYRALVVSFPEDGLISNRAEVVFQYQSVPGGEINTGGIPSNAVVTPVLPPDYTIAIAKTADRTTVAPGESIRYTLTVTNLSNAPLTNVRVTDPALQFEQVIPFLPSDESRTFEVTSVVPLGTAANTRLVNTADAVSDQVGPVSGTAIVTVLPVPGFAVRKTADRTTAFPGDTIVYTIAVTNTGNAPLNDVHITDSLLGLVETIPSLPQGQVVRLQHSFSVPLNAENGSSISNVATVVAVDVPPQISMNEITVAAPLMAAKSSSSEEVSLDGRLSFTIIATNIGPVPLLDVALVDVLPEPLEFIPDTLKVNGHAKPGAVPDGLALGTLPSGAAVRIVFQARLRSMPADERIANQASVTFRVALSGPLFTVPSNTVEIRVTEEEE
ncbi:DUF7507 domain-containing protein [Cohnella fermenti]|uniref:DUF11 domain-containing protein n=1 Tax=Cohnella fermenti TaxID=2565925 RepID=A0A4S4BPC2_9BACL|nr:DUF11 domain-containing protein [Cohnella fermenti]THF76202.1 DUF11 domain-containing protein [Cohnella fermenti]